MVSRMSADLRLGWCVIVLAVGWMGLQLTMAQNAKGVAVEKLFPTRTVMYATYDGGDRHQEGWKKTAAYEALHGSGMMSFIEKLFKEGAKHAESADEDFKLIQQGAELIISRGYTSGICLMDVGLPAPIPQGVVVVHEGGVLVPHLGTLLSKLPDLEEIAEEKIEGRSVQVLPIPDAPPGLAVSWWDEGGHLVMTVGLNGPRMLISHIKQGKGSVADHPMWERIQQKRDGFEVTSRGWFDFGGIREAYAEVPIPGNELKEGVTVGDIIEAMGLGNAGAYTFAAGYKGRAFHSETEFDAPGERKGLLKLLDQKSLTLDDLPPLPAGSTNLCMKSLDLEQLYDTIIDLVRKGAEMGPPEAAEQVEGSIGAIPDLIGFDPKGDLLSCLGGTWAVYPEPRQGGIFGMGISIVCSVREAKQLQETVGGLLERGVESAQNEFVKLSTTKKRGRDVTTLQLAGFFAPSMAVDKEWMIISLTPQTVESFLMRVDGKLEKWSPSPEQEKALAEFPKSFTSLTISDPRVVYEAVSSAAPFLFGLLQQIPIPPDDQKLGEILDLSVADIPPAELVGKPLFPNVSMTVLDEKGCSTLSRQSAPSFPLMGNSASFGSVGTISVLTALLLPAVQQAREAARRTQSQNNLKQIGLSLHNYHDVNNTFPRGTVENEDLEDPEDRLSWLVEVLPYLEEAILFEKLDLTKGSKDEANQEGLSQGLSVFMSPSQKVQEERELGRTDYVGIAGVGEEELTTEEITAKSGVFGYNRRTGIRDITDGTSNTIMVMDVSKNPGPWGVGGPSTVRALTKAPYINGPDGLGGIHRGGAMVLFADGSVRFISEAVDDEVMEGLVTIQGGENVSPD